MSNKAIAVELPEDGGFVDPYLLETQQVALRISEIQEALHDVQEVTNTIPGTEAQATVSLIVFVLLYAVKLAVARMYKRKD